MKENNLKFNLSRTRNTEHYRLHDDILHTVTTNFATAAQRTYYPTVKI